MRKKLPSAIAKPTATVVRFTDYAKPRENVVALAARHDGAEVITLPVVRIERAGDDLLDNGTLVTFTEIPAM